MPASRVSLKKHPKTGLQRQKSYLFAAVARPIAIEKPSQLLMKMTIKHLPCPQFLLDSRRVKPSILNAVQNSPQKSTFFRLRLSLEVKLP